MFQLISLHKTARFCVAWVIFASLFLGMGRVPAPATAQSTQQVGGGNLLVNPRFDDPWSKQMDLCGRGVILEEVQVPNGWTAFYKCKQPADADNINRTPEFRVIGMDFPERVRSPKTAMRYFNFWALNESAGIYQTVNNLVPGSRVRFSLWVQLWSSNSDDLPPTSKKEPGDMEARVCVKQDGGAPFFDRFDPNLICNSWSQPNDAYYQLSVEATAASSQVTVLLNTRAKYAVKHNDVHADDAELIVVGAAPAPAPIQTAPPQITTNEPDVNLRAAPDFNAQVLAQVPDGTIFDVRGYTKDKQWWQVVYAKAPGGLAYVNVSVATPNDVAKAFMSGQPVSGGSGPGSPVVPTLAPIPTLAPLPVATTVVLAPVNGDAAAVTARNPDLNVRAAPNFKARVYVQVPKGTAFEVVGRSDDKQWWQVKYPGGEGGTAWVLSHIVIPNTKAKAQTASDKALIMANREQVSVRNLPSFKGKNYGFVAQGTVFEVIGRSRDKKWYKVIYAQGEGGVAWLATQLVKANDQAKAAAVVQ